MKLNVSYPATGCQKLFEITDEHKLRVFYEKRMGAEVEADSLGDEWKGYMVRVAGGNDRQGFPMKQGVLTNGRVRLLLSKGHSCYRPRRTGERKRKSVRGCIVDANLSVLALVIIKKGEQEIPGLTDKNLPRRLGPKRAGRIRKLFNLSKEDDVREFVVKRPVQKEGKKEKLKAPKIQRLITPITLQRKRHRIALIKRQRAACKEQATEYAKLLAQRQKEAKAKRAEEMKRKRSASMRDSRSSSHSTPVGVNGCRAMVSSWLSSDTNKSQNTSRVEPIKSLLRSLNLNRARLPGTLTFRGEPPGPDKSLCEIVSRISNCVDIESKSMNEQNIDFIQYNTNKNNSQESFTVNSRTESEFQSLSTRKNDETESVISTGNYGTIYKRVNLDAKSLETIRRWGSARSFAPKIGDINNDMASIGLKSSQKKVASTFWPKTSAATGSVNFNNELWPSNFINGGRIFDTLNNRANMLANKLAGYSQEVDAQPDITEFSENTSTQTPSHQEKVDLHLRNRSRIDKVKNTKHSSQDNSFIDMNNKKLDDTTIENPYHRIHLSINNYFNSPPGSPSISPRRSKLKKEIIGESEKKVTKKNVTKVITKRKFLGKVIKEKKQIKSITPTNCMENNEDESEHRSSTKPEIHEVLTEVDVKITSEKEMPDINISDNNDKIAHKIIDINSSKDSTRIFENYGKSNLPNYRSNDNKRKKDLKIDIMKKRLEAVLSGERKTVAKPSEILIPHSVRARHIFQPFADIEAQTEMKMRLLKNKNMKNNNKPLSCANGNPIWKPSGCVKSLSPTTSNTIYQHLETTPKRTNRNNTNKNNKNHSAKKYDDQHTVQTNIPVLRSKTFLAIPKHSNVDEEVNDEFNQSGKITEKSNETMDDNKFINRHTKSLRMWKELLANTAEYCDTEEPVKYLHETVSTDRSSLSTETSINNVESQTSRKSDKSQSVQTTLENIERSDVFTETDADLSLFCDTSTGTTNSNDNFPSLSTHRFNQTFVDAQVSCNFPTITSFNNELSDTEAIKSYRMIETQTSKTSFQSLIKEKKDTSVETIQIRLHSKYVNTERCVLIDSATGKDVLEIQNFCCDTQLTNTESTMFDNQSIHDLKIQISSVESRISTLNSLMNIGIQNTSTDFCVGLISSLSNELMPDKSALIDNSKHDEIKKLPESVIKAFEFAAERAHNLYQAIEIFREYEIKKQNEMKILTKDHQKESDIVDFLRGEEDKTQSLSVTLKQISESEKALQEGLTKLIVHQEVQFTLETLLDQVEEMGKKQSGKLNNLLLTKHENYIESKWRSDLEKVSLQSLPSTSGMKILPIVYGAVCTIIFCSLQFSTSCELT
ncbi:hypothetical protein PV328_001988 [Microctonus aethiopoides]|uniref:Small ribosomal subunit protein eS6 n=1 Tax=Microctonus aethiopoides TaxID=144406 RepID=A0AA39KY39_9HYME|nr:hypothetical protein PV328_001988 [Microctonus aethiopoides]